MLRRADIFLIIFAVFGITLAVLTGYGQQVTAVKSCVVTSTYVPFGASHINARGTCDDGSNFDAVWSLQVGCEPRVGDHVTVTFYRALWNPQLTGDVNC